MSHIAISIDVTLLQKARFKEMTRKNGNRAVFCDLILVHTPDGKFGDYMVKQQVTKEEREARVEMPILGNGKTLLRADAFKPKMEAAKTQSAAIDDVPF